MTDPKPERLLAKPGIFALPEPGRARIMLRETLQRKGKGGRFLRRPGEEPRPYETVPAGTLGVATYNIHCCVGADGRYDPERVAMVLRELDADIVALQEVGRLRFDAAIKDQAKFLAEATGLHMIEAPEHQDYRGRFGNAILSRWPARNMRVIDLTAGFHGPRNAIDAEFEIEGRVLRVIATHFGLQGAERRRQIRRLLDTIGDWPGDDRRLSALVMMGDLNEWRGRRGAIPALEQRLGPMPLPPTFPAWLPLLPLDRIYAASPARLLGLRVQRSAVARRASDHLPLCARLVWPN